MSDVEGELSLTYEMEQDAEEDERNSEDFVEPDPFESYTDAPEAATPRKSSSESKDGKASRESRGSQGSQESRDASRESISQLKSNSRSGSGSSGVNNESNATTGDSKRSHMVMLVMHLCCVYFGSYIGIITRIGCIYLMDSLFTDTELLQGVLHDSFFANTCGCFFLGIFFQQKNTKLFETYPFLYDLFAVGFTGSLTTFSAWQVQASLKIVKTGFTTNGLLCIFIDLCCSLGSFKFGLSLAKFISEITCPTNKVTTIDAKPETITSSININAVDSNAVTNIADTFNYTSVTASSNDDGINNINNKDNNNDNNNSNSTSNSTTATQTTTTIILSTPTTATTALTTNTNNTKDAKPKAPKVPAFVVAIVVVVLIITIAILIGTFFAPNTNTKIILAMLCGPVGACIRYYSGLYNKRFPKFPLFTFLANIIGSFIYAVGKCVSVGLNPNSVLYLQSSLLLGFCGALTTVSTMIQQLHTLTEFHATVYLGVSLVVGQFVIMVVLGVAAWVFKLAL